MFGQDAMRLLREFWPNAQSLAEELFAIFKSSKPLEIDRPVQFRQTEPGVPPITIMMSGDADAPVFRINRVNPETGQVQTTMDVTAPGGVTYGDFVNSYNPAPPYDSTSPGRFELTTPDTTVTLSSTAQTRLGDPGQTVVVPLQNVDPSTITITTTTGDTTTGGTGDTPTIPGTDTSRENEDVVRAAVGAVFTTMGRVVSGTGAGPYQVLIKLGLGVTRTVPATVPEIESSEKVPAGTSVYVTGVLSATTGQYVYEFQPPVFLAAPEA